MNRLQGKRIVIYTLLVACMFILVTIPTYAAASKTNLTPRSFELAGDSKFVFTGKSAVKKFSYGKNAIGIFSIGGNLVNKIENDGWIAFSTDGNVSFEYKYTGGFHTDNKDAWNLDASDSKSVNGISTAKVKNGAIIVQKSATKSTWENVSIGVDYFNSKKNGTEIVYNASETEFVDGMYYRVIVAYTMKKRIEANSFLFFHNDDYSYRDCVEVYEFYLSSSKNHVTIRNLSTGSSLTDKSTTASGFYIDKGGSNQKVIVRYENDVITAGNYDFFSKSGNYIVEVTADAGKKYSYSIAVTDGQSLTKLAPSVYESKKNSGFHEDTRVSRTVFGTSSLTELSLGVSEESTAKKGLKNSFAAYGITGDSLTFYLKIRSTSVDVGNGYSLFDDEWGKKEKQKVNEISTGEIGKGAVIIQTSRNGSTWTDVNKGRYASGLYTTDFASHYKSGQNVKLYTPNGNDIINGTYFRVYFAYQVYNKTEKEYIDYLEKYSFYVCSNELGAVTFHNLSAEKRVEEVLGDASETTVVVYKQAETLLNGSCTTTGFSIDKSLNPTVTYKVYRDGTAITEPKDHTFTETGKYEINLKSVVGDTRDIVIYVDRNNKEEALSLYFGESFLTGKRIFAEGEFPVYEGGLVQYNVSEVADRYLPLKGTITNQDTKSEITIDGTREAKSGTITEAGPYIAQFITNAGSSDEEISGDSRLFSFQFSIIPNGSAPGPVVNEKNLEDYSHLSMVDSYPVYYGLKYLSALNGDIWLVFSSEAAALDYAYEYEKGMVVKLGDGTYRYTGSLSVKQKERYDSAWDLTDAVYYFAEQAIQTLYFDMSDPYSYCTLAPDVLTQYKDHLRTLELRKDVYIFAEGQKEQLTKLDTKPFINDKPYAFLNITDGTIDNGSYDFEFIKDQYGGLDSSTVVIIDQEGREYPISYSQSVEQQLNAQHCPSGILTIKEETMYGDVSTYKAVYIAPGDNTTNVTLTCYENGTTKEILVNKETCDQKIVTGGFSIKSIEDAIDKYSLVLIRDNKGKTKPFVAGSDVLELWTDPGNYNVNCVNRLGYGFTFNITVEESNNVTVSFTGIGTEEANPILTVYGAQNVQLPALKRYGYRLKGFEDANGEFYNGAIQTVPFQDTIILNAIWEPVPVNVIFLDEYGNQITSMVASYGNSISLATYQPEGHLELVGWDCNGTIIKDTSMIIGTEDPLTLRAVVTGDEAIVIRIVNAIKTYLPVITGASGALITCIIVACVMHRKTKHKGAGRRIDEE